MDTDRRFVLKALAAALASLGMGRMEGFNVGPGVHRVRGEVRINGQPAAAAQPIPPGALIETGADGEALYVVGDNAFLQRAASRVEFPAAPAGHASGAAHFLRVLSGRILSVFGPGDKEIATPAATIGIRGTACYIEVMEGAADYFCLCYGRARITPRGAPKEAFGLETRHHDSPFWLAPSGTVARAAPIMNHTDDELTVLENLAGRWPPFYGTSAYGNY